MNAPQGRSDGFSAKRASKPALEPARPRYQFAQNIDVGDVVQAHSLARAINLNGSQGTVNGISDRHAIVEFGPPHGKKFVSQMNLLHIDSPTPADIGEKAVPLRVQAVPLKALEVPLKVQAVPLKVQAVPLKAPHSLKPLAKSTSCPILKQVAAPAPPARGSGGALEYINGSKSQGSSVCPFVELSDSGIEKLVKACQFDAADCVYDIGCGKGNVMEEILRRYPCRGVAVDINASFCREAKRRLQPYGDRIKVLVGDVRVMDLSDATAVVTFFPSVAADKVKSAFASKLRKGSLWFNYSWPVPGWHTSRPPTDSVYRYVIGEHLKQDQPTL